MKPANFAPVYCALYPMLAEIARKHGYAMAIHGSLARDFDLICIPWVEFPNQPQDVIKEITETFAIRAVGEPDTTHHGRLRQTICVKFGECAIDLQFMPRSGANPLSGPLADALLKLYTEIKKANAEVALEMEPLFSDEIDAIDRILTPDLIDRVLQSEPHLQQIVEEKGFANVFPQTNITAPVGSDSPCEGPDSNCEGPEGAVFGQDRTTSGAIGQP